jgi:HprK-related kinase B
VVKKNKTGMFFIFDRNTHIAAGPCLKNANQVVNFVNSRFIQHRLNRKALLLHAAGVQFNGKGMSLAGFSGAGKSTLALHIMNHGTSFVSNDRIMIEKKDGGMRMYGVAKMPRINPGTIIHNKSLLRILKREEVVRYRSIERETLWDLEEKHDAYIDEVFGKGRFTLSAPFDCLVILNWDRAKNGISCSKVDLASRRDLLPAVMKSSGIFFLKQENSGYIEHTQAAYIEYFSEIDIYEITGGCDFEKGAEICMEIFGN